MKKGTVARRVLGATIVAATAVSVLAGCVGGPAAATKTADPNDPKYSGTVQFWTVNLKKSFGPYITSLIDGYEKKHPQVTIDWVDVPGADITTKLLASIASGQVPDLVNYTSDTVGLFADSMTDLSNYFTPKELSAYSPTLVDPLKTKSGSLPAIPWYNSGGGIATWRTSVVDKAGFTASKPPKTWDQMLQLAQKVHDATGVYGTDAMAYSTTVQSYGLPLLTADHKKAAFDNQKTVDLLKLFKKYYDSGAIAPGVIGKDNRAYEQTMSNKGVAFIASDSSPDVALIKAGAPDVYSDLTVTPAAVGSTNKFYLPNQQVFGVPAKSKHKAAAAEFLKWVTSPASQLAFCKIVPIFPSTSATLKDPFFTDVQGETPTEQARKVLVSEFPRLIDGSLGSGNDAALRNLFDEQVRAYIQGQTTAEDALKTAAQQWNQTLKTGQVSG